MLTVISLFRLFHENVSIPIISISWIYDQKSLKKKLGNHQEYHEYRPQRFTNEF